MKTGMDSSNHLKGREKLEIKCARMTFSLSLTFSRSLQVGAADCVGLSEREDPIL